MNPKECERDNKTMRIAQICLPMIPLAGDFK